MCILFIFFCGNIAKNVLQAKKPRVLQAPSLSLSARIDFGDKQLSQLTPSCYL